MPAVDYAQFHNLIAQGMFYPTCDWVPYPLSPDLNRASPSMPSATSMAASQAQFTPVADPTISKVQTLRQTISQGHPHRTANLTPNPTPTLILETKFLVRIAYGSNEETKTSNYQVYSEAWLVRINNAIPIEYLDFMAKLRVGGFSLGLPHINTRLNAHLNTDWNGKWALSANHLDGKDPIPNIWQP